MSRIKTVHFIHDLSTGGAETLVKNYFLNFDRSRFDVLLLCLGHEVDSPYEETLKKFGIKMIFIQDHLPFKTQTNVFKKTINYLCRYIIIKKTIRKEDPVILHTHLMVNRFVKFTRLKQNTIIYCTIHSDPKKLWKSKERKKELLATRWLIKKYGMKFIVLHGQMKNEINRMFGVSDSIVLNNGVDVEALKNARNSGVVRKELSIPNNAFVLGHIGRFSEVKNQKFLVDVFIEISRKNANTFLLLVGDGPDKNEVIKKLERAGMNGRYLILSNRNDVPDLLSAMDVFVFPSLYEGLPLSLVEAQIARKPCFISNQINKHAVISNLVTILSFKDGAKKWANVILDYKKPAKMVVKDEDWDIRKITKQLEQIYLDALAEKQDGKK